jgi:hypothetical protein
VAPARSALAAREVQIHPGELVGWAKADDRLNLVLLDVRDEADYNLFHIQGAGISSKEVAGVSPARCSNRLPIRSTS